MDFSSKKLSVPGVYSFLASERALIVHFSGTPPMNSGHGEDLFYPDDLLTVIRGDAMGGISCSVVRPGDCFDSRRDDRNACGSVGVIVGLQSEQSLIGVDPADCGSFRNAHGIREIGNPRDITLERLQLTLTERDSWNEWVVRDYVILGIFVGEPPRIWKKEVLPDINDTVATSVEDIQSNFPNQRLFMFDPTDVLVQYTNGQRNPVQHTELYSP